jgi:uncharacterized membrane protein YdjX (TVP38/TMEM64 family)
LSAEPKRKLHRLLKDLARVLTVVVIFGTTAYVLSLPAVREQYLDVAHAREYLRTQGNAGIITFTAVTAVATGLGVPRLWISALAGALFGATMGTAVAQVASLLGAIITFYIARILLRSVVLRRMPERLHVWYERFNTHGFFWLFYIRLFPFANATVTNMIGGVSKVSLTTFLAATFLGYLPETLIFAIFGSSAVKKDAVQFGIAVAALAVFLLAERMWQYFRKRARRSSFAKEATNDIS